MGKESFGIVVPPPDTPERDQGGGGGFCWICEMPMPVDRYGLRLCGGCAANGLCATCAGTGTVGCFVELEGSMGLGQRTCPGCGGHGE